MRLPVRFAFRLSVALTAATLVACGGDAAPVPLAQRFVTPGEAPGSKPDPVEKRRTTVNFAQFISSFSEMLPDPDREEMTTVFREAGFKGSGLDARFFGEKHKRTAPHVFSSFIELESEDGARSALDWIAKETTKPCPGSCAVKVGRFDVEGIADARSHRRTATAEDIASFGTEHERPFDGYWVGFTIGSFLYTVELTGPPGSVSEAQAQKIASAYYDRLTGN
ncbi:MAG TPA: hypothetical protein VHG30_04680 [Microvirga sp.]|nr:hypothetical protein [Microvirga sp.]